VHSWQMVQEVELTGDFEAALYSASGSVRAAEEIAAGRIDNAFVFTSFGDHHAGRDFYAACAISTAPRSRLKLSWKREYGGLPSSIRMRIMLTARGTSLPAMKMCCTSASVTRIMPTVKNKVDVLIPGPTTDEEYLARVRKEFVPRALVFQPEFIFWEYGYDATKGDYGDKGISPDCHIELAKIIKGVADRVCDGKLVAVLCGGSQRATAAYTIPRIISVLADREPLAGSRRSPIFARSLP